MPDVVANRFEIGRDPNGVNLMSAWIHEQAQTNILASVTYSDYESLYCLVIMSTNFAKAVGRSVGSQVSSATFGIRNDLTALTTWMNAQNAGIPNPNTPPTLATIVQGSLTGQGTVSVKYALVDGRGNTTVASPNATIAVPDNSEVVVAAPPPDAAGLAVGYNVYIGTPGHEILQNAGPIPFGGNFTGFGGGGFGYGGFGGHNPGAGYTQTSPLLTSGTAAPTTNATAANYLQHFSLSERGNAQKIATLIVSN